MSNKNVIKKLSAGLKSPVVKKKVVKEKIVMGFLNDYTPYAMKANQYEVTTTLYGYHGSVDIDISEYNNARTKKDILAVKKFIKVLEDMIKEAEDRFL
jgi:hypothetical protein